MRTLCLRNHFALAQVNLCVRKLQHVFDVQPLQCSLLVGGRRCAQNLRTLLALYDEISFWFEVCLEDCGRSLNRSLEPVSFEGYIGFIILHGSGAVVEVHSLRRLLSTS